MLNETKNNQKVVAIATKRYSALIHEHVCVKKSVRNWGFLYKKNHRYDISVNEIFIDSFLKKNENGEKKPHTQNKHKRKQKQFFLYFL